MNLERSFFQYVPCTGTVVFAMVFICNLSIAAAEETKTTSESAKSLEDKETSVGIFSRGGHDTTQPIAISSDMLELKQEEEIAVFAGNVDAIQGEMHLRSQSLEVYYASEENGGTKPPNSVTRMRAFGRVFLSSPEETAEGDWADYDVTVSAITLHDNVLLTRGKNVLCGQKLDMDLDSGRSVLRGGCGNSPNNKGRVQGLFYPAESDDEMQE